MKITRIRLFAVRQDLRHSFETSSHRKSGIEHIIVEATDEEGRRGWGEIAAPSDPYFGAETTTTAWEIATRYLVPALVGAEGEEPADLEMTWARVRGNEFARAGFSGAVWDLFARRRGLSLATALGGTRDEVVAGVSLGIEPSIDELLGQVELQRAAGYPRVKLKIAPGWDVEPVRAVRDAHPDLDLHVDANGAYPDDDDAAAVFTQLDALGLTMIEQPFAPREMVAHATLQARIGTAVCLDESVIGLGDLRTMIRLSAARILNIKVSRMGGLTVAKAAHDLAVDAGIPVWCGGMHEFGIGRAANVAISALPGFLLPSDVSGSDKYYVDDIIAPPVTAVEGRVQVPRGAGIGHDVLVERIERAAFRTWDSADTTVRDPALTHG